MEFVRLEKEMLEGSFLSLFLALEKPLRPKYYPSDKLLEGFLSRDTYCCMDRGELVGIVSIDANSKYLGGSARICRICYDWQHNTEAFIARLICGAARFCPADRMICMDVEKKYDINRPLYSKLGFRDSVMDSPVGKDYSVMVVLAGKLAAQYEDGDREVRL